MANKKRYMLDSTVLIHDPNAMFAFEDNELLIPTLAISDLKEATHLAGERGANARLALRNLVAIFEGHPNDLKYVPSGQSDLSKIDEEVSARDFERSYTASLPEDAYPISAATVDNHIKIVNTFTEKDILKIVSNQDAILVSKDTTTRLLAIARQIHVEDYKHDRIDMTGQFYSGRSLIYLSGDDISTIKKGRQIQCPKDIEIYAVVDVVDPATRAHTEEIQKRERTYTLTENEFLIIRNAETGNGGILGRYTKGCIARLESEGTRPFDIDPRNVGQKFAIEALMAPWEIAPLVILKGPAGTAKTFLSMACGLEQTLNQDVYTSMLVTRPASLLDESIGFLPGTEQEKVSPLLRSVFDNTNILIPPAISKKDGKPTGSAADELISRGILQVQSMSFMRGRSVNRTFIVLDEAQNCSPAQMLTIATRIANGSKLVVLGDPMQIDAQFLDIYTNGLTFLSERMRGSPLVWQVTFNESECERSLLATEAIRRLG